MLFKIGVLTNFANFTGNHLCRSHVFLPEACNFVKKRFQHSCFSIKFAKFLRTPIFTKKLRSLLLNVIKLYIHRLMRLNYNYLSTHHFALVLADVSLGIDWDNSCFGKTLRNAKCKFLRYKLYLCQPKKLRKILRAALLKVSFCIHFGNETCLILHVFSLYEQ